MMRNNLRSSTEMPAILNNAPFPKNGEIRINRYSTKENFLKKPKEKRMIPVYVPGPKPSELLLRYLNAKTPPKLTKLEQIRKNLHRHSLSNPGFPMTNKSKLFSVRYIHDYENSSLASNINA